MDTPTNLSHEEIERQIYAAGDAVPFALFTQYRDARDEEVRTLLELGFPVTVVRSRADLLATLDTLSCAP